MASANKGEVVISALGLAIYWVLSAYLLLLIARMVIGWVMVARPSVRSTHGAMAVFCEVVFSATEPPLRFLRRFIPPLPVGPVSFDLGFLLLVIVIVVLRQYALRL